MKMTSVIVDNEENCRENLKMLLTSLHPEVNILGLANSVKSGVELIQSKQPDILFLDIQLGDGTGFDILEKIDYGKFATVFVTAFDQYAPLAFDFAAMAYLVKPIDSKKLSKAIHQAHSRLSQCSYQQQIEDLKEVINNYRQEKLPDRLAVSNSAGIHYIPVNNITYLSVSEGCTEIHQEDGKRVIVSANLIEYERRFDSFPNFMKVHRSYVVNLNHVSTYHSDGEVLLFNGQRVLVSKRHQEELKSRLEGMSI